MAATSSTDRVYSSRVGESLAFAAELHAGQRRKGKAEPYLSHILTVTALVTHYGGDEDQIIAAALHDSVEDQGGSETADLIRRKFGDRVAEIVLECSDAVLPAGQPKPPWRARKEAYLARLGEPDQYGARLVEACDKLANLRDIVEDVRAQGPDTLGRFSGGPDGVCWYYRELSRNLMAGYPQLRAEFRTLTDELCSQLPSGSAENPWMTDDTSTEAKSTPKWLPLVDIGVFRLSVAIVAAVLMLGFCIWELSQYYLSGKADDGNSVWSQSPFASNFVFAVLLGLSGGLLLLGRSARRKRHINAGATVLALAGMVDPLLRIHVTLASIRDPETDGFLGSATAAKANGDKRLKFVQPILRDGRLPADSPQLDPTAIKANEKIDATLKAWLVKQSLTSTAALAREWADLLALTEEGSDGLVALQELRNRLQVLQPDVDSKGVLQEKLLTEAASYALAVAIVFEDATPPESLRRPEFAKVGAYMDRHAADEMSGKWKHALDGQPTAVPSDPLKHLEQKVATQHSVLISP